MGIFDAGGSAFDSEVWCDGRVLDDVYKRPNNIFQSATVHLSSPDAFQNFKDAVSKDPRLDVDVSREIDYYAKQSQMMTRLITVSGRTGGGGHGHWRGVRSPQYHVFRGVGARARNRRDAGARVSAPSRWSSLF